MAKPDSRRPNQDRRDYDEFRESLATTPNRTYRSAVEPDDRTSVMEQVVRVVALVLCFLLAMRFIVSLFTANVSNGFVNFFRATTNWIVAPFQSFFGSPPAGTGGFFDWPALAALICVGILATLLISLMRPRTDY
ncbi:MAG: hypothetical protein K0S68_685 [Candidatus Saccharibacteria bacterium]|jgi:hypothetical protein|nr:hypothetical protein [Candidatus Saccharibacteria bacterium]